jgi:hypothetical protein
MFVRCRMLFLLSHLYSCLSILRALHERIQQTEDQKYLEKNYCIYTVYIPEHIQVFLEVGVSLFLK